MADEGKKPDWLPNWVPEHGTLKFSATVLQLFILILAAAFLTYHLVRGKTGNAQAIIGNTMV